MKNPLLVFIALLLFPCLCFSQSYNPFPGAYTYTYSLNHASGDQLHSVRVDTLYPSGADVMYEFNSTFRLNNSLDFLGTCGGVAQLPNYDYDVDFRYPNRPSAFGNYMLARPGGRYDFVDTLLQDTFRLESALGIGNSWTVNVSRGLTATLDSITFESFLGVTDSVQHISLCNGKSFQLSKQYGALTLIPWVPVHHPGLTASDYPPQYALSGIEETGFGTPRANFEDIYGFDANDKFQFFESYQAGLWDSYDKTTEYIVQNWGPVPTGIGGNWTEESVVFSQSFGVLDTNYSPPTLDSIVYTSAFHGQDIGALSASTTYNVDSFCGGSCSVVILEATPQVGGRTQYDYRRFRCSGGFCYPDDVGWKAHWSMQEGLGTIYDYYETPFGAGTAIRETELICYETSWGMGGTCVNLFALATDLDEAAFESQVTAWQDHDQMIVTVPAGVTALRLFGMDGKLINTVVHDQVSGRITTSLPWLSSGLYILEVRGTDDRLGRKKLIWR